MSLDRVWMVPLTVTRNGVGGIGELRLEFVLGAVVDSLHDVPATRQAATTTGTILE
jgi:hypothetical protein